MKRLSIRFGYDLRELIRTDTSHPQRLVTLEDRIRSHRAEAVFVPSVDHLDGQLSRIVAQADVIEQNGETYARWSPIAFILGDLGPPRSVAPRKNTPLPVFRSGARGVSTRCVLISISRSSSVRPVGDHRRRYLRTVGGVRCGPG